MQNNSHRRSPETERAIILDVFLKEPLDPGTRMELPMWHRKILLHSDVRGKICHGNVSAHLEWLIKYGMITKRKEEQFRNSKTTKKFYIITDAGILYLLLDHGRKIKEQATLLRIDYSDESGPVEYDLEKAIPCLYPKDEIWEKLIESIKKRPYRWCIPPTKIEFFESDAEELLRAFVLLSMYHFVERCRMPTPLFISGKSGNLETLLGGNYRIMDYKFDIGLDSAYTNPYAADFILGLISGTIPMATEMYEPPDLHLYRVEPFINKFRQFLLDGRNQNSSLFREDVALLIKQAKLYLRTYPNMLRTMQKSLDLKREAIEESIYLQERLEKFCKEQTRLV